ncbi:hypothetical protein BDQ17DRAFT_1320478 [Cyathus striatus]|nr:hypothetical protein BDQ17DRAFT_1320478 [Cyathus striatus]
MSDKAARSYTHASNRTKRQDSTEKKNVFKGVLDNPYRVQWPSVPINLQNAVLARLISLLDGASDYHRDLAKRNRKRKRSSSNDTSAVLKKRRTQAGVTDMIPEVSDLTEAQVVALRPPTVLQHLVYGINEVTKRLEAQVRDARRTTLFSTKAENDKPQPFTAPLRAIFVCRADVDPAMLVNHFPHLVAAFNSACSNGVTKLFPLPKGAETSLAQSFGIKRVTVIAIDAEYPELSGLLSMIEAVPSPTAPWLIIPGERELISTHVKQLRTTAPKDMKEAKQKRVDEKKLVKGRQKI